MMPKYSVIIPVYYNEGALSVTMTHLKADVLDKSPYDYEVIFIDDGSGDNSLEELKQIQQEYPQFVKVLKLTRNFGQVSAIMAGLSVMTGHCAIVMSADNQDPANLIMDMLDYHFNQDYPIVIAQRTARDESWFRVWTSQIFYRMMKQLSFERMPGGGFDFVLLGRQVVDTIQKNIEATPFFQGQILWTGFDIKFIDYKRQKREIGESRWTLTKKITYLLDGVMSYSFLPIRLMSGIGFFVAILGFIYAIIIVISKLVWGLPVEGWAPIMVSILIIGGMQMLMLGVIGEYLWRVLAQVRNRDLFIIEETYSDPSLMT